MSCVRSLVLVDSVVSVAVVGDDDNLVVVSLSCLYYVLNAVVDSVNCLCDSVVDTGVANHVAVSEVYNDEVVLLSVDSTNQLILHLVCAHLRLQVVCSNLRRRNKDAVLALVRSLAATVEEECYVSVLLSLSSMQLTLALSREILAESVCYVLLREEDVNAGERCVVRSHAEVLQTLDSVHTSFLVLLLCEHLCELLSTVVAVVDEDYNVAFLNLAVNGRVVDRKNELVGYALVVALLHCLHHVVRLLALALNEQVVSLLDALPTLVAVHCIEAAYDACDVRTVLVAALLNLLDEALARLRVGVAAVHEAVYVYVVQAVLLANLDELEEVVE